MYLLDTDILSLFYDGDSRIGQRMRHIDPAEIATTIVTKIQILRPRYDFVLRATDSEQLLRAQQWLHRSESRFDDIPVVPLAEESARVFDTLRADRRLRKIGRADLLIACIALANRATVVTRNVRHFRVVPNLQMENWAD